jgi:hypothetical protein
MKFTAFTRIRKLITIFIIARHSTLSWKEDNIKMGLKTKDVNWIQLVMWRRIEEHRHIQLPERR